MKHLLFFALVLITHIYAQNAIIKGQVSSKTEKEPLVGVNISVKNTALGTTTSDNGYYVLPKLPVSEITLVISHVGYAEKTFRFYLKKDTSKALVELKLHW